MAALRSSVFVPGASHETGRMQQVRPAWHGGDPRRRLRLAIQRLLVTDRLQWEDSIVVRNTLNTFVVIRGGQVYPSPQRETSTQLISETYHANIDHAIAIVFGEVRAEDTMKISERGWELLEALAAKNMPMPPNGKGTGPVVKQLSAAGLVERMDGSRYMITAAGREMLATRAAEQVAETSEVVEEESADAVEQEQESDMTVPQLLEALARANADLRAMSEQCSAREQQLQDAYDWNDEITARLEATIQQLDRKNVDCDGYRMAFERYRLAFEMLASHVPEVREVLKAVDTLEQAFASFKRRSQGD